MFRLPIVKFFNRIFNRVTITVVLVALQVLWLLWAFWSFTAGRVWLNGALKALSILIVLYLVRKDENSAYKIGWIVLIGLLPLLGGALYLAFGNKAPAKYLRERMQKVEQAHQTELAQPEGQTDALDISSRNLSRYVAKFGPYPAWRDTAAHYFSCGEEMYPQLLADLEKAEKFIFLEFFILRSGKMWDGVEQILRRKAAQGVDVRLIYDDFGSLLGLPSDFVIRMEKAHIRCIPFNPVVPLVSLVMNHRDHRKIVVIDNKVAYVGGFNVGKEYIDLDEKFGHWRDTHLRICGSAVLGLQVRFVLDWNYAAGENLFLRPELFRGIEAGTRDFCDLQIISSGPDKTTQQIHDNYLRLINKAQKSIYIQTPYFIPDEAILNALMIAVKSGIEVNIMIPCMPDHPFVYWATYSYLGDMVMAGANCYTYNNGFLHSKGMIVDDRVLCYGTANMDIRSFALNFEVNAVVYDEKKAWEMVEIFHRDLEVCRQITRDYYTGRNLKIRIKEQVCRLLSPLL